MEEKFVIIGWPEIQDLMELPDFRENTHLINDDPFLDTYGSSAYFVSEIWLAEQIGENN